MSCLISCELRYLLLVLNFIIVGEDIDEDSSYRFGDEWAGQMSYNFLFL